MQNLLLMNISVRLDIIYDMCTNQKEFQLNLCRVCVYQRDIYISTAFVSTLQNWHPVRGKDLAHHADYSKIANTSFSLPAFAALPPKQGELGS